MHRSSNTNMNNKSHRSTNITPLHTNTHSSSSSNLNMSCHQRILSNQERQHAVCNKYAVFNRQSSDRGLGMNVGSTHKNSKAQPAGVNNNKGKQTPIPKTPLSVGGLFKRNKVVIQKQDSSPFPASLPFAGTESQAQPPTYLQAHLNVDDGSVVSAPVVPLNNRAARRASRRRDRVGGAEDQPQPHNSNQNSRSNSNSRPRRFGSVAKHFGKQILGQLEGLLYTSQADTKQSAASKAKKEPPQAIYDHPERPIADFSFYTKAQLVIENDNEFRLLQQALRERHAHNGTPLTTMGIRAYMLKDKLLDERAQRMRDFRQEEEHERQLEERRRKILVQQQEQAQRIAANKARSQAGHYNSRSGSMDHRGRNSRAGSMDHGPMLGSAPNSPRRAYISSGASVGSNASANSTNQRNLLDGLRKTSMGLLREGVRTFDRLHTATSHAESNAGSPLTPTRPVRRMVTAPAHPQRSPVSPLTPPRPARRTATAPAHQRQHPPQLTSNNSELSLDVEFGNSFNINDEDGDGNSSMDVPLGGAQTRADPQSGPARTDTRPAHVTNTNVQPASRAHASTRPAQPAAQARSTSDLSQCDLDEMEVDFHTSMPTLEKMPMRMPITKLDRQTSRELDVDFNRSMPLKLERHISEGDEYFHDRSGNAGSGNSGDFDLAAQRAAVAAARMASTAAPVFPVSSMASARGAATAPLSPVSSVASGRLASAPLSPGSSVTSASTTGTPRGTGRRLLKSKRHPNQVPSSVPSQSQAGRVTTSRLSNNNRSSRSPPPPQSRFPRRAVTDPYAQAQTQTSRHSSASSAAMLQEQMEVDFNTSMPLELDQPMDRHVNAKRNNHRNTYLIDPPSPDQQGSVFSAAASEASSIMSRRSHASRSATVQRAKAAIQGHGQSHSQGEVRTKAPPSFPSFRKDASSRSRLAQHAPASESKPNSDVNHMLAMMAGTTSPAPASLASV